MEGGHSMAGQQPQLKVETIDMATQTIEFVDEASAPEVFEVNVSSLHTHDSPFFDKPNDSRPYMDVDVNGISHSPLVDTGAVVCVLAVTNEKELAKYNEELLPVRVFINTVHNQRSQALGVMNLLYTFECQKAKVPTVVIKVSRPQLIVGMNFVGCSAFI